MRAAPCGAVRRAAPDSYKKAAGEGSCRRRLLRRAMRNRVRMQRALTILTSLLLALTPSACSQHAEKTAERSVSPLVGSWTRDGDLPKPDPKAPEFTALTFAPDGSLAATYVAAGGALAAVVA